MSTTTRTRALALPLLLLPLFLAGVATTAEEGYRLERKLWKGQRLKVEERQENAFDYKVKASGVMGDPTGRTSQTGKSVETKLRVYSQQMTAAFLDGRYRLERTYEKAVKETSKGGSAKKDVLGTSLNGKTVILAGRIGAVGVESEQGPVADDDKNDATFPEKIYGILPTATVKTGESWNVPGEVIGPIFFGPLYNPVGFKANAKGRLKDVVTQDGRKCARILLQLELAVQRTEQLPGVTYKVEGNMLFGMEEGTILTFDIAGPVQYETSKDGAAIKVDGSTLMRYRATVVDHGADPE
ncbi:MAG: hypothetical protein HYZ53_11295 [Planctomycetes bacterium]|nr:hypothetical protein [Planctomycetota bacterium]